MPMGNVGEVKVKVLSSQSFCISFVSDLLESNILVSVRCQCANIFYCECDSQNKFTIAIGDFGSIKPFLSPGSEEPRLRNSGTPYYRSPEVKILTQIALLTLCVCVCTCTHARMHTHTHTHTRTRTHTQQRYLKA